MSETKLHRAVRKTIADNLSHHTVLNMIQSGADTSVQNQDGLTPAELALSLEPKGRLATAMVIQECDALQPVDALKRIITRGSMFLFETLLEHLNKRLELDVIVASLEPAIAELKTRNVLLSDDITNRIHYLLVEADYQQKLINNVRVREPTIQRGDILDKKYQSTHENCQNRGSLVRVSDTEPRVLHLVECIEFLEKNYRNTGKFNDMDDRFELYLRQILEHVFFLKNRFKQLPLMQLQFCLAMFLKIITEESNKNVDIYVFMLDKEIVIDFLTTLKKVLKSTKNDEQLSAEMFFTCLSGRPSNYNLRRNVIVDILQKLRNCKKLQQISKACTFSEISSDELTYLNKCCREILSHRKKLKIHRFFRALFRTYNVAKSFYSFEKMIRTIETVSAIDFKKESPKATTSIAALKRALQILGETFKSTSLTPNITRKLDRILRRFSIQPFVDLCKQLRQHFSHGYSLEKQNMEQNCKLEEFKAIRDDLITSKHLLEYILSLLKISVLKHFLVRLKQLENIDRMRSYVEFTGMDFGKRLMLHYEQRPTSVVLETLDILISANKQEDLKVGLKRTHELLNTKTDTEQIMRDIGQINTTLKQNFFLNTYILQPAANANRVRIIVNCMLRDCYRPPQFEAVYDASFVTAVDIIHKLRMKAENFITKEKLNKLWKKLTTDNCEALSAVNKLLLDKEYLVLEKTTDILEYLGPIQDTNVIEMISRRLSNNYYHNLFDLNNKYHVLYEVVKNRRIGGSVKELQLKLKQMRSNDERLFQQKFVGMIDSIRKILEQYKDSHGIVSLQITPVDRFAIEYYLLEATEVLCSLKIFQDNTASLNRIAPVVTGRNLRNYLAHDALAYDALTESSRTIESNAIYLLRHQIQLYRSNMKFPSGSLTIYRFAEKIDLKTVWITDSRIIHRTVKTSAIPGIFNDISELDVHYPFMVSDKDTGNFLLHSAVLRGYLQLVARIVVRHAMLLNVCNSFRETPLALAVRFGYRDIVQCLLKHGAIVHYGRWTCVYIAACLGDLPMIKLLGAKPPCLSNPLMGAVRNDHFDVFVYLHSELGYKIVERLLYKAIQLGRTRFVRYILKLPEGKQLINVATYTPLMMAANFGRLEVFQLLIENYANPYAIDELGNTVLSCAVDGGNRKIIDYLLSLPNISHVTQAGDSPLRRAIGKGNINLVKYLLSKGFKPSIDDAICAGTRKYNILQVLLDHDESLINARVDTFMPNFLIRAIFLDKKMIVMDLIARGIELNATAFGGYTALHNAVNWNNIEMCKLLLDAGCDLNISSDDHWTALDLALEYKYIPLAKLLLSRGADAKSVRDYRFLHRHKGNWLHKFASENRTWMVRFLLEEFKFDKNVVDDRGKTALDYAKERGNEAIVRMLQ